MSIVYRKTSKGQAEIETRAFRLAPRLRQALILVDGRKTDLELSGLIASDAVAALAALRDEGFIEALATLADAPEPRQPDAAAPAAAPIVDAPKRNAASFESLRRDAVRALTDALGPAAEGVALKLERAKSMAELRPLLVNAAQLMANVRGAEAARTFTARFLGDDAV